MFGHLNERVIRDGAGEVHIRLQSPVPFVFLEDIKLVKLSAMHDVIGQLVDSDMLFARPIILRLTPSRTDTYGGNLPVQHVEYQQRPVLLYFSWQSLGRPSLERTTAPLG